MRTFLLLSLVALIWTSCEKDTFYVAPPPDPTVVVSFANDIQPIFNASCLGGPCHDNGSNDPDLSSGNSYQALIDNNLLDTANPENSMLYRRLISTSTTVQPKRMPPSGNLPASQIESVLLWISQGANNN